jgi:hypothetical protein
MLLTINVEMVKLDLTAHLHILSINRLAARCKVSVPHITSSTDSGYYSSFKESIIVRLAEFIILFVML